ncbi:hypothetical protein C0992_009558, partial [Termitomyces sp. T32_za158]
MRSLLQTYLCATLLLTATFINAIHESDVGVVDWHKFLVGAPLVAAPATAPSFYHFNSVSNSDIIYAATTNNVLAALNPKDGSVAWRYVFEADDRIVGYYPYSNFLVTLSGPGGANFRVFDSVTGAVHVEKRLHAPKSGHNTEPLHFGTHVAFGNGGESYVLTDGHVVRRIDAPTGDVQWTWASQTESIILTNLVFTSSALFAVAATRSGINLTLHVTVLEPQTGTVLRSREVPSNVKHLQTYTVLSISTSENIRPHVVWIENGQLKSFKLTPDLDAKPDSIVYKHKIQPLNAYERILDVGVSLSGSTVVVARDGSATLLSLEGENVMGIAKLASLMS